MPVRPIYVTRNVPGASRAARPRDSLYRDDGSRRPDAEIVREQGTIGLRAALLDDAIVQRFAGGEHSVHYPLRLFLSYKWGTDAENAWVARLAHELQDRGWDVVFDGDRDESVDRSVEEFVSRIATCSVFLAVATPAYVRHAIYPKQATWVFDEYSVAMSTETGMYCIALAPGGELYVPDEKEEVMRRSDTLAPPFVPGIVIQPTRKPRFDEIHDLPALEGIRSFVGEHLNDAGSLADDDARARILEGLRAAEAADADEKAEILRAVLADHPFVAEAWSRLYLTLAEAGNFADGEKVLRDAIENVHPWECRLDFERERIAVSLRLQRPLEAVHGALDLLKTRPMDWAAHAYVGSRLDDCDELWGARNHLVIACEDEDASAEAYNTLGVVYLGLGMFLRARQCFETALRRDATLEMAKRNFTRALEADPVHALSDVLEAEISVPGCTVCPAVYPMSPELPVLCVRCGGRRQAVGSCPACEHEGVLPVPSDLDRLEVGLQCPTCRRGSLTRRERVIL